MQPNGAILYQGPSLLDGSPIVAIAVGLRDASTNRKTGAMLQTYILRSDLDPIQSVKSGADSSICGDCPHRGTLVTVGDVTRNAGRTCYVNIGQGPLAVYRAFKAGRYAYAWDCLDSDTGRVPLYKFDHKAISRVGAGRVIRLGTYGDPAAVPASIWADLVKDSKGHTGYTHQWRKCDQRLKSVLMASADSVADAREAQALGWRTFRVAFPMDSLREKTESICPASAEAGKKLTCEECLACCGADGRRGNIVIQAHGGTAVLANVKRKSNFPITVVSENSVSI